MSDGLISLPGLEDLRTTSNIEGKRKLVRGMAAHIMNRWESVQVNNVEDGHIFRFGDTGKMVYQSPMIPQSLSWLMLVIESDQDIRDLGSQMETLLPDSTVDSLAANILTLAATAANPQSAAAIAVAKVLISATTKVLKGNKDDQLGYIDQSFIKVLHYPQGTRVASEVQDLTGNMWYDYTIFAVQ